jgi:ribosomal protein L40E
MLESTYIKEYLQKSFCYKCGASLQGAKLETIKEAPIAFVAHAVCNQCQAESMVTITTNGGGITPLMSDLNVVEFKKFMSAKSVSYDELINLHKLLSKNKLCNLLDKKENNLVKKSNSSEKKA